MEESNVFTGAAVQQPVRSGILSTPTATCDPLGRAKSSFLATALRMLWSVTAQPIGPRGLIYLTLAPMGAIVRGR